VKKILLALTAFVATLCCQQLAAQTQINQANISSFPYVINKPGSYVLTSNLTVPSGAGYGIYISSPNVTVNLNGFAITGSLVCTVSSCNSNTVTYGIYSAVQGATVENGFVSGFFYDVEVANGSIKDMTVSSAYIGIYGSLTNIHHNVAMNCAGYGIYAYFGTVSDNTVNSIGDYGIYAGSATVMNNNVSWSKFQGIVVNTGLATGNSVMYNTSADLVLSYGAVGSNNACSNGPC
jgi:hypothetical protein